MLSRLLTFRCAARFVLAGLLIACAHGLAAAQAGLLGVNPIEDMLPFFDGNRPRDPEPGDEFPPLRVLLSRSRFWAQDGHLDVVAQLNEENPQGELRVRVLGANGQALSSFRIAPLPGPRFVFYPAIPDALANGGQGEIEIAWVRGGQTLGEHREAFRVQVFNEPAERSGRIPVSVPNAPGVSQDAVPATVGVPFPRGALDDAANLRLVDEAGSEVPLQVKETARWSKFGSVKWVLCDFTVDLDGGPRELFLEYGPGVSRAERPAISVTQSDGFPVVDAGRLRFDQGLWFDAAGDGSHVKVLEERGLSGAFVEHEDGRFYRAPLADRYEVEEQGPEKVVLRREGWYQEEGGDRAFCNYVTRYVIHRDSPLVRVFHTWIFTGDGNRDRIRNMGWEFALPQGFERRGFLTTFGEGAAWEDADYLLQWDYDHFDLVSGTQMDARAEARAPGVAAAQGHGVSLYFGARDFWQNYPSELEFRNGSLWFHNWPRHNRPTDRSYDHEAVEEAELNRSIVRGLFAHEGRVLDFRIPDELAEDPLWTRMSRNRPASSYWLKHEPETANAQGIARTEEMWLYFEPQQAPADRAEQVLEGLNEEALRAIADPAWVAQSGAFYEMHHQDWDKYPEQERIFELLALSVGRWIEWTEMYGMWTYGDIAAWNEVSRNPSLYRARRKAHHGWPYSWVPFARSGDPRLLRIAEAFTRQMVDANYCHYVDEAVKRSVGPQQNRTPGNWARSTLSWVGRPGGPSTRTYETNIDYLLHAWHLAGHYAALDNIRAWAEHTKVDPTPYTWAPRGSTATLKAYLEAYEHTFDPYFLAAAHATADSHMNNYRRGGGGSRSHFWQTGDREYMRYTDCQEFREYYMAYADAYGDPRFGGGSWGRIGAPVVESQAFAWRLTGDEYYLRRVAHFVDWVTQAVYDADEPEHVTGSYMYGHQTPIFTGWGLDYFGMALAALEDAEYRPDAIGAGFQLRSSRTHPVPPILMRKEPGRPLPFELAFRVVGDRGAGPTEYRVLGPDGREVFSGTWGAPRGERMEIPADAPAGDYRLLVQGTLDVPVSDIGTREVIVLAPGQEMPTSHREGRYWFMVPEGVEEFSVETGFPHSRGRISVWDPDGNLAWNFAYHSGLHADMDSVSGTIQVAPEHWGRLWRIGLPGHGAGPMRMDPQIPPVFSVDRERWYMPDDVEMAD